MNQRTCLIAAVWLAAATVPLPAQTTAPLLKRMDANGNGQLEPGEIPSSMRLAINRAALRAGLDPTRPISIQRLQEGQRQNDSSGGSSSDRSDSDRRRFFDRGRDSDRDRNRNRDRGRDGDRSRWSRDSDRGRSSSSGSDNEASLLVPGFDVLFDLPPVPGFGVSDEQTALLQIPLEKRFTERLIRYVDDSFRRYDSNGNRVLDADEWKNVRWSSDPHESDLNRDGRLTRAEFAERMARRWGSSAYLNADDQSSGSRSSSGGSIRIGSSTSSPSSRGGDNREQFRRYAESYMKRYDRNGNGVLEREEWRDMRGDPQSSDRNGDGKITLEEMTDRFANYSRGGSSWGGGGSSGPPRSGDSSRTSSRDSSSRSSSGDSSRRRGWGRRSDEGSSSRRSESSSGKLPKWFGEYDTDGDGQVRMSEYSATWSASKLAEFYKYDVNDDGIITAAEAVEVEALK